MPSHTPDGRIWYDINEACKAAGVSRRTIYNWMKAKKIEVRKTPGGMTRISSEALLIHTGHPKVS